MGSLLAATREAELDVRGLTYPVNDPAFELDKVGADIEAILTEEPNFDVAFGVYVWNEQAFQYLGRMLRLRHPERRIILGGPQISYSGPGLEERYPFATAFVRGYGESALVEILSKEGQPLIKGVHWAGCKDRCQQAKVDLEAIPSPFLMGLIDVSGQQFVRWEAKRGCSFRCAFCQHREAGSQLRRRELDRRRLLDEIEIFCRSGVEDIAVLDPIFNQGPDYLEILDTFVGHQFDGRLSLQCRFELVDESFLELVSELNCTLEFGLQTIHRDEGKAVRRPNHMPKVEEVIEKLHRLGIHFEVSLIFGLPRQTLNSFEQSVAFCLDSSVPVIKAFPLMLLRGTHLERQRDRWNLVESDDPIPMVIESDSYSHAEWKRMAALSAALKDTEGSHPTSFADLRKKADEHAPDPRRWSPDALPQWAETSVFA